MAQILAKTVKRCEWRPLTEHAWSNHDKLSIICARCWIRTIDTVTSWYILGRTAVRGAADFDERSQTRTGTVDIRPTIAVRWFSIEAAGLRSHDYTFRSAHARRSGNHTNSERRKSYRAMEECSRWSRQCGVDGKCCQSSRIAYKLVHCHCGDVP